MIRRIEGRERTTRRVVTLCALLALPARADYESHPELRPENRCASIPPGVAAPGDPGGAQSLACQRLFWDLPAAPRLGFVAAAAALEEKRVPRYPNGRIDRPPPLYILDLNHDGVSDDGQGYEQPGPGRAPLCSDPDQVPWWKPLVDAKGQPLVGPDPTSGRKGPLFEVACRRGNRARLGPWQVGRSTQKTDDIAEGIVRFENSQRLDRDEKLHGLDAKKDGRREWVVAADLYNHFAIHHSVCWVPESLTCSNPQDPWTASDMSKCYEKYQRVADGPDSPRGKGGCYAGDQDTRCQEPEANAQTGWFLTTVPGRFYGSPPDGQALVGLERQLWRCFHHVVFQYPPDDTDKDQAFHMVGAEGYGLEHPVDYRLQKGGLVNIAPERQHDTAPGEVIGGAVGEMIIQYFTEPYTSTTVKPLAQPAPVRSGDLSDYLSRLGKKPGTPKPVARPGS